MKEVTRKLLNVLKKNPKNAIKYFQQISLGSKTDVKFGFVRDNISITFIIYGKEQDKNLCISQKIDRLFDTEANLEPLNKYLDTVQKPIKFHFSPYLKINKEPLIFAGRVGVEHKIEEK